MNRPFARTIEFGEHEGLPSPQRQFTVSYRNRNRVAQNHGAKMRVGVLPATFGKIRIIVAPVIRSADHALEKGFYIVEQRLLKFVNETRRSGMQGLHQNKA